jgi:hypothetical protein
MGWRSRSRIRRAVMRRLTHGPVLTPRLAWIAVGLALTTACFVYAATAEASPARYIYEQCDSALPGGGTTGVRFLSNPLSSFQSEDTCAEPGGALGISQTKTSSELSYWEVPGAVPPGGEAESITITAAVCPAGQNPLVFAYRPEWSNSCHDEVRTFKEDLKQPFDYYVWLGCNPPYGPCAAGPWVRAHYFATTEVDPVAPTITELAGTLLAGGVIRGRQTLRAAGHDRGGGVSDVAVQVNGVPAAPPTTANCQVVHVENPSVAGTVATTVSPCPEDLVANWTLDTGAYPFHAGENTVQACVSDFATLGDPNTTCSPPHTITVDDSCTESPVAGGQILSARFKKSGSATETVRFGKSATVIGRLANGAGEPIADATLCVKSQMSGVEGTAEGTVGTNAEGRFSYKVAEGPNREIVVGYRSDAFQVTRNLRFLSHTRPSLVASPRRLADHQRVHFRGRLPGPRAAARVVILQANVLGSKRWITFRRATSGAKGRFRATYQFTSTTQRTVYRFRAEVPVQAGYPWLAGSDRPVRVVVTP